MFIMGIDQYGQHYDNLGKFPRKELVNRIGGGKVSKMYVDKKNGSTVSNGYVIGNLWITLYRLNPIEKEA